MPYDPSPLMIRCADGVELAATRHAGGDRAAVLIAPALGVPRRFYDSFAQYLAGRGFDVLSFDYRGLGESGRGCDPAAIRLADWARLDLDAALRWLWEHTAASRRVLLGHSLGGQLPGLAPESEGLNAMIAIGASAPYPRLYPLLPRLRMLLLWRVLVPLLSRGRSHFPARRIGFSSVDVPAGPMRDWAGWGLRRNYLFDPATRSCRCRCSPIRSPTTTTPCVPQSMRCCNATLRRASTTATSAGRTRAASAISATSTRVCATACGATPQTGWNGRSTDASGYSRSRSPARTDVCGSDEAADLAVPLAEPGTRS
jgi:predicted alpha/beta hydrolase